MYAISPDSLEALASALNNLLVALRLFLPESGLHLATMINCTILWLLASGARRREGQSDR